MASNLLHMTRFVPLTTNHKQSASNDFIHPIVAWRHFQLWNDTHAQRCFASIALLLFLFLFHPISTIPFWDLVDCVPPFNHMSDNLGMCVGTLIPLGINAIDNSKQVYVPHVTALAACVGFSKELGRFVHTNHQTRILISNQSAKHEKWIMNFCQLGAIWNDSPNARREKWHIEAKLASSTSRPSWPKPLSFIASCYSRHQIPFHANRTAGSPQRATAIVAD